MGPACLIACQGSAQLVAAMVAAGIRFDGDSHSARPFHVLVHDLHAPLGQAADFVRVLEQVASLGRGFRSLRYLSPDDVAALDRSRLEHGVDAAGRAFAASLGLGDIGELYLGQNAVLLNELLRRGLRHVRRIGYGDSVGMNFTPWYFAPQRAEAELPSAPGRLRSTLSRIIRRALPRKGTDPDPGVDVHRLLLPNLFDQRLDTYEITDPMAFRSAFAACSALQPASLRARSAALREAALHASSTVILLSTNFSEAGKMSVESELAAYASFVGGLASGANALLIIKPHPRDSHEKIGRLREVLAARFDRSEVLDDAFSFYLPFEVIYADGFDGWPDSTPAPTIAGFSTAVLSLEYIYGARCMIGFGEDLVQRHVAPEWRQHRLRHERDLHVATDLVHRNRERPLAIREWPRP